MPGRKTIPAQTAASAAPAFATFLEYTPAARLSRNLRKMLIVWLMAEQNSTPPYYEDLLHDLNNLFDLLDAVEGTGN